MAFYLESKVINARCEWCEAKYRQVQKGVAVSSPP